MTLFQAFDGASIGTALFLALVVLVIYKRLRRNIGRQKVSLSRLVIRIFVFGSLFALLVPLLLISNWLFLGVGVFGTTEHCHGSQSDSPLSSAMSAELHCWSGGGGDEQRKPVGSFTDTVYVPGSRLPNQ